MNTIKAVSALFLGTLLISGTAVAEGKKLAEKLSGAVLCPGLPLNSQKSFMCLMAYEDNLSLGCQLGIVEAAIALEMGMMAIDYSIKACEADADKFCLDVEAGEGRIVSCLRKNEAKLTRECTTALKETGLWDLGAK